MIFFKYIKFFPFELKFRQSSLHLIEIFFQISVKNKVIEIDKALVQLESKVRQTSRPKEKPIENNTSKLPTVNNEESLETQKKSEETVKDLDSMQL